MPTGIYKRKPCSEETKEKIRKALLGTTHNHAYKRTKALKLHMSKVAKEKGYGKWCLGRHLSEETKKKIGLANSIKMKQYLSLHPERLKQLRKNALGRKMSKETREKMSKAQTGKPKPWLRGEKSRFWKGGVWKEEYPKQFTDYLKRKVRKRDNYTCKLCKIQNVTFHVHHIDYNKKNNTINNLITLCEVCHGKTNGNRDYWSNYFNNRQSHCLIEGLQL